MKLLSLLGMPTLGELAPPQAEDEVLDRRFLQLVFDLKPFGGLMSDADVRNISFVARPGFALGEALLSRSLYAISWRHRLWLPMFQFSMPGWRLLPASSDVVTEMFPAYQGYELTEWFLTPSPWLEQRRPVELLHSAPGQVRHAARVDRYLVSG